LWQPDPGSGKTKVLVHKLASLLLMEDVKHEQLLMLTFSRAAATEFKKRLLKLIGNAANYIEIKTFIPTVLTCWAKWEVWKNQVIL
jgi:ATP-dependent DNA helicase RecQ